MRASLLLLLLPATLSRADTCSTIAKNTNIDVAFPLSLDYLSEQSKYWSTSCSALEPSCILFPTSAADVSTIIQTINEGNESFAIKSGGHNPNNYFSSVAGGPLISTARLDEAILDSNTGVLRMGPGNRLDEYAFLVFIPPFRTGFGSCILLRLFKHCSSTASINSPSRIVLRQNSRALAGRS